MRITVTTRSGSFKYSFNNCIIIVVSFFNFRCITCKIDANDPTRQQECFVKGCVFVFCEGFKIKYQYKCTRILTHFNIRVVTRYMGSGIKGVGCITCKIDANDPTRQQECFVKGCVFVFCEGFKIKYQ